ncbi:hypothetical protein D3C76_1692060 [compost metagenome]
MSVSGLLPTVKTFKNMLRCFWRNPGPIVFNSQNKLCCFLPAVYCDFLFKLIHVFETVLNYVAKYALKGITIYSDPYFLATCHFDV